MKRIPRIEAISRGLAQFLENSRFSGYDDVTLVGHSQGGQVIQSYLAGKLKPPPPGKISRASGRQSFYHAEPGINYQGDLRLGIYDFQESTREQPAGC